MMTLTKAEALAAYLRRNTAGHESASDLADLIECCARILRMQDGIVAARGLIGERENVYAQQISDALGLLIPLVYKWAEVGELGWELALKWFLPDGTPPVPTEAEARAAMTLRLLQDTPQPSKNDAEGAG